MMSETKSVLDNIPVVEKGFPLGNSQPMGLKQIVGHFKEIVGHCPHCGAPIYGQTLLEGAEQPTVTYSCRCWHRSGVIEQTMEKK